MFDFLLLIRLCTGLVILLLSSNASEAQFLPLCTRHTVTTYPLAAELNRVYRCTIALGCPGGLTQIETKRISGAGGQINQWLVSSYDVSLTYTAAQQDMILQNAKQIALNNKPVSKFVASILFDWTDIPDLGASNYFVGATITYAKCGPVPGPTKRQ